MILWPHFTWCNVLPTVSRLCCVLQSSGIDLSQLHSLVSCTIETLELLLCMSTDRKMNTLDADLENSLVQWEISVCPESMQQFQTRVYVPFIKVLISHIKDQLPDTGIFAAFLNSGSRKASIFTGRNSISKEWWGSCRYTGKHYWWDGAIVNSVTIKGEWLELRLYLSMHCTSLSMAEVPKLLTTDTTLSLTYPNFVKLTQVRSTLPISTADCERAFSTMRRIKSRLRSEMWNLTLNHCMRISIEGPPLQQFDSDAAVDAWSVLKNRRTCICVMLIIISLYFLHVCWQC